MKIIRNIQQGTDEWLRLRLGKATASEFSKIITPALAKESATLPKYALELATEMLLIEPEETYKSADMERGNELEEEAREAYQEYTFNSVEQVTFIDCGDYGSSPDGLIEDGKGIIEIKCPKASTHLNYIYNNVLPMDYKPQVQGNLMISDREYCDFISYHPNFKNDKKLFIHRVYREEEFIKKLKTGIDKVINLRNEFLQKLNLKD